AVAIFLVALGAGGQEQHGNTYKRQRYDTAQRWPPPDDGSKSQSSTRPRGPQAAQHQRCLNDTCLSRCLPGRTRCLATRLRVPRFGLFVLWETVRRDYWFILPPTLSLEGMETMDPKMAASDIPATKRAEPRQWFSKVGTDGRVGQAEPLEANRTDAPANIPTRYEVLSQLGTGGMGIVYKVRDLETGEIVALKILKPGIASDQTMQVSLRNEVCLARKVT